MSGLLSRCAAGRKHHASSPPSGRRSGRRSTHRHHPRGGLRRTGRPQRRLAGTPADRRPGRPQRPVRLSTTTASPPTRRSPWRPSAATAGPSTRSVTRWPATSKLDPTRTTSAARHYEGRVRAPPPSRSSWPRSATPTRPRLRWRGPGPAPEPGPGQRGGSPTTRPWTRSPTGRRLRQHHRAGVRRPRPHARRLGRGRRGGAVPAEAAVRRRLLPAQLRREGRAEAGLRRRERHGQLRPTPT